MHAGSARASPRGSRRCRPRRSSTRCSTCARSSPTTRRAGPRCSRYLAWGLSGNWDQELLRTWIRERAGDDAAEALLPPLPVDPPTVAAGALHGAIFDALPRHRAQGSNDWVVAAEPDRHRWRAARERPASARPAARACGSSCTSRRPGTGRAGSHCTFSPGILLGTTDHHAWGVTNVSGDVQDLYVERLNEDRTRGRVRGRVGAARRSIARRSSCAVRTSPTCVEVRETRHGPILDTFPSGVARRRTRRVAAESDLRTAVGRARARRSGRRSTLAPRRPRASRRSARPRSGSSAPARTSSTPTSTARSATRAPGGSPCDARATAPRRCPAGPASTSGTAGSRRRSSRGRRIPQRGFLATANNRIHDEDYPHLIGHDFHPPHRARTDRRGPRGERPLHASTTWCGCSSTRSRSPRGRPCRS